MSFIKRAPYKLQVFAENCREYNKNAALPFQKKTLCEYIRDSMEYEGEGFLRWLSDDFETDKINGCPGDEFEKFLECAEKNYDIGID